ncbi:DUF5990 family protein [Asticcacaulis sp. YBE204]|uniref:DUF5990 family protein n=1 Tax=Asticcacaulis sp. YBE204 TaxID=1282363 RepID=UPI0003C3F875|nr:DUF5990 family protein [Asticcacaulis sp. YBE204]ESQ81086.1 hypothetical protein AEYBE204_01790 [Asticcacaulis sp. YBE204]
MADAAVILRLTIKDPVPGVRYSLQDKDSRPVDAVTAGDAPLSFDVPVRLSEDGRWLGPFVRREGAERRFIYIAIGRHAGDPNTVWDRRAKIDIHTISPDLCAQARAGHVIEAVLPGRGKDGTPACATVRPVEDWHPG